MNITTDIFTGTATTAVITTFMNTPRFEESSDNNNYSSVVVVIAIIALVVVVVFITITIVVIGIVVACKRKKSLQNVKEEERYYSTIDETTLQRLSNKKPELEMNEKQDSKEPQYIYMDVSTSDNITEQGDKATTLDNSLYCVSPEHQIKVQNNPAYWISSESQV